MKKTTNYILWLTLLSPIGYLLAIWNGLPDTIPIHFNMEGVADRFGKRSELLWMVIFLIVLNIGTYYMVTNAYKLDSRKKYSEENKPGIRRLGFAVSIFLTVINLFVIYSVNNASEGAVSKGDFVFSAVGLLYCAIGNYIYSIKPNSFVGIRMFTTLNDGENWRKTHQVSGKLWFWGGLATAVSCALLPTPVAFITFIAITLMLTVIPIVYSLWLHKTQKDNQLPGI